MAISKKYEYDRFGMQGKRVGQAVQDILSAPNNVMMTADDVIQAYKVKFTNELQSCIDANIDKYEDPFYVLVLSKKEMWATNMVRNWFVARQTAPRSIDMMTEYANYTKTLYRVNKNWATVDIEWSLPGYEECKTVLNNPAIFDPELVKWVKEAFAGNLDSQSKVQA